MRQCRAKRHGLSATRGLTLRGSTLPANRRAAGAMHSCGLIASGAAYCWGIDSLSLANDSANAIRPKPVAVFGGIPFAMVSAGNRRLLDEPHLRTWEQAE